MNSAKVFFNRVLTRQLTLFEVVLQDEIKKLNKDSDLSILEEFPRQHQNYKDIVLSVSQVAAFDSDSILQYLCTNLITVFQFGKTKVFKEILDMLTDFNKEWPSHLKFVKAFQIILYTDLIYHILKNDPNTKSHHVIIQSAYKICAFTTQQDYLAPSVLPQWSLIMYIISKYDLNLIYTSFSNMMVNKPENYFILLQYVDLSNNEEEAQNLIEILYEYIARGRKKNNITSRMLSSVSTMLRTYKGSANSDIIKKFKAIADAYLDNPKLKYGAIELRCCLYFRYENETQQKEFFEKHVFPLYDDLEGFKVVIKAFYLLLVGNEFEPDFQVSGDIPFNAILASRVETETDKYLTEKFMHYIFGSPHFNTAISQIRNLLIKLAERNFSSFINYVEKPFLEEATKNQEKFITFLRIVPIINKSYNQKHPVNQQETQESRKHNNELTIFNQAVEEKVYKTLENSISKYTNYGIETRYRVDEAEKKVSQILNKWQVPPGEPTAKMENDQAGDGISPADGEMMDIIPYIIDSRNEIAKWVILLIKFAACGNSNISIPATKIVQENLDSPKHYDSLCEKVAAMVKYDAEPEIVWVCLHLLYYAANGQEPRAENSFDELAHKLEFTAFIGLASAHPEVRHKAFELLIQVNKLRRNQGIMTHIERDTSTIESNVKHSILLTQFSEKPGVQGFHESELYLPDALLSPYQYPWLYFLAEFGRILPEAPKLLDYLNDFVAGSELQQPSHFRVGILVLMVSSHNELTDTQFILNIIDKTKTNKEIEQFLFTVLKHSHYTIIKDILTKLVDFPKEYIVEVAYLSNILLRTIEEMEKIRIEVLTPVFHILTKLEESIKVSPNEIKILIQTESANKINFLLSYLSILHFWLDTDISNIKEDANEWPKEWNAKRKIMVFELLATMLSTEQTDQLKFYASQALFALVKLPPFAGFEPGPEYVEKLIWAEEHDFRVLQHLVENNVKYFFDPFVQNSYKANELGDYYFAALSKKILMQTAEVDASEMDIRSIIRDEYFDFMLNNIEDLLLLGLYKIKTNNSDASDFVQNLVIFYVSIFSKRTLKSLKEDLENDSKDIIEIMPQYFIKKAESLVQKGLVLMKDNFVGTTRNLVMVLKPWIKQFRILPNSNSCIPSVVNVVNRMSPARFLEYLADVTEKCKRQDFEYICKLWRCLLRAKDHKDCIIYYIGDMLQDQDNKKKTSLNQELKKNLFLQLIPKLLNPKVEGTCSSEDLIAFLAQRCKFSYYAFVAFQQKSNYEDEYWYVQVLTKAVKNYPKLCEKHMHVIIQYALLFHSLTSQAQGLFKRICRKYKIKYSRRTLSPDNIRKIVQLLTGNEVGDDLPPGETREVLSSDQIKEWAMEASRWVIGSNSLRNAYTSLVILNEIKTDILFDQREKMFNGICRSVSHFLRSLNGDTQGQFYRPTYDFINETFKLFRNHFKSDAQLAFKYIKVYFDFVIAVDAYFDSMLPLFMDCLDNLPDKASRYSLTAVRPIFNELESDSKAMKIFEDYLSRSEHTNDIEYVTKVLHPLNEKDISALIEKSSFNERNSALGHFALMVTNASTDLKRRIFVVATSILKKNIRDRQELKNLIASRRPISPNEMESSTLESSVQNKAVTIPSTLLDTLNSEVNKPALNVIFTSALDKITSMQEAVDFVCHVSQLDPDIPNNVSRTTVELSEAYDELITKLEKKFTGTDEIVTLTNCEHLDSTSNLLSEKSEPSILPFTTQHEMVTAITNTTEVSIRPFKKVEKWVRLLYSATMTLMKGISAKASQNSQLFLEGNFYELQVPSVVHDDAELNLNEDNREVNNMSEWLLSKADFVNHTENLDDSRKISRANSSFRPSSVIGSVDSNSN